jgi:hypothetical protein
MSKRRVIWCCPCEREVRASLVPGSTIYPHLAKVRDIAERPFWRCPACANYVGCHYLTTNRLQPLGSIPSPEVRAARAQLHKLFDPLWRRGRMGRSAAYQLVSDLLGRDFHIGEIRSMAEAEEVRSVVEGISAAQSLAFTAQASASKGEPPCAIS